jgi:ubiquitin carboxyl-terminal hydrolase 25/28
MWFQCLNSITFPVVKLLSGLFMQMMCVDEAAITPEIELAKLALVTSKDEEDDAIAQAVTTEPANIPEAKDTGDSLAAPLVESFPNPAAPIAPVEPATGESQASDERPDAVMLSRPASPPILPPSTEDTPDLDEEKREPATIVVPVTQVEALPNEDKADPDTSGNSMIVETGDEPLAEETILTSRRKSTMAVDSGAMMFGKPLGLRMYAV